MPFLVAALLVVAVHSATAIGAWRLDDGLAINSALHCGTALLWFVLVRRLCGSNAAALATAVVFVGWPGHGEITHGIPARAIVLSMFCSSLALLAYDAALARPHPAARWSLLAFAAVLGGVAVSNDASGWLVVPLAAALSWLRATSARQAIAGTVSVLLAAFVWSFSVSSMGGPGVIPEPAWQATRIDLGGYVDWLSVLLAPVHQGYGPANMTWLLAMVSSTLLVVAAFTVGLRAARGVLAIALLLLVLGCVAGIGREPLDAATLQNVRNTYPAALGLCTLLGVGIAMLPFRARGAALAIVVVGHALALDQNRQPWLRAAVIRERILADMSDVDRLTQRPFRVIDVPHEHDGAVVELDRPRLHEASHREELWSADRWRFALHLFAACAASGDSLPDAWFVQWDDGALVPFVLDPRWPQQMTDGTSIPYARIARVHPFAGTMLPVHVLVQTTTPLRLHVDARVNETTWSGPAIDVAADTERQPIALDVMLPASLAGEAIAIELVAEPQRGERRTYPLGTSTPVERR